MDYLKMIIDIAILVVLVFNLIATIFFDRKAKVRENLVKQRLSFLNKMMLPVLDIIKTHYVNNEEFEKVNECVKVMKLISESSDKNK